MVQKVSRTWSHDNVCAKTQVCCGCRHQSSNRLISADEGREAFVQVCINAVHLLPGECAAVHVKHTCRSRAKFVLRIGSTVDCC